MSPDRDLHAIAACVHSVLVAFHVLGIGYAIAKQHRSDGWIHLGATAFSVRAVRRHLRQCR